MKSTIAIRMQGQLIRFLAVFLAALTLAACGGGDGFPGYLNDAGVTTEVAALRIAAPSAVTVSLGSAQSYRISGGVAPYLVVSSNSTVVPATLIGDSSLSVPGNAAGSATVSVFDSSNLSVTLDVTVPSAGTATALYLLAPEAGVTLAAAGTASYTLGGGTAGYQALSSNPAILTASIVGSSLNLSAVSAGTASVTVFDAAHARLSLAVTVQPASSTTASPVVALFTTAPSAITIAAGAAPSYAIHGGTLPYSVVSSDVRHATASVTASTLSIVGLAAGSASVVITDAIGAIQTIGVTVSGISSSALVVTPSSATANVGDVLSFRVSGGSPSYGFVVNNPAVATLAPATVSSSGDSFSATLLHGGSTTVAVVDALGQSTLVTLTATTSPPAPAVLTLSPAALTIGEDYAEPITLAIQNGTAPYRAFTSDLLLSGVPDGEFTGATLAVAGPLPVGSRRCITPGGAADYVLSGTYPITITVLDSLGAAATSVLTIQDNGKGVTATGC